MAELVWDLQDADEFYEAIQRVRELLEVFNTNETFYGYTVCNAIKRALDGME